MTKRHDPNCLECKGTGERDSGGVYPWGAAILVPCDCDDPIIPGREIRGIYWPTMRRSELDRLNKKIDDGVNAILAKCGIKPTTNGDELMRLTHPHRLED